MSKCHIVGNLMSRLTLDTRLTGGGCIYSTDNIQSICARKQKGDIYTVQTMQLPDAYCNILIHMKVKFQNYAVLFCDI